MKNIDINNKMWQTLKLQNSATIMYLYAAYLDVRQRNPTGPTVRITAIVDGFKDQIERIYVI